MLWSRITLLCCTLMVALQAQDGWTMNESGVVSWHGDWVLERSARLLLEGSSVDRYRSTEAEAGLVTWALERYDLQAERRFLLDEVSGTACLVDTITNDRDEERVISVAYEFWLSESIASIATDSEIFDLQQSGLSGPIDDVVLQIGGREQTSLTAILGAPVSGVPSLRSELRRSNCVYSRFQLRLPAKGSLRVAVVLPDPAQAARSADIRALGRRWYTGVLSEDLPLSDELRASLVNFPPRLPRDLQVDGGDDDLPLLALAEELGVTWPESGGLLVDNNGRGMACSVDQQQTLRLADGTSLPMETVVALRCEEGGDLSVFSQDGQCRLLTPAADWALVMTSELAGEQRWQPATGRPGTVLLFAGDGRQRSEGPLAELRDGQRLAVRFAAGISGTSPWGPVQIAATDCLQLELADDPYPYLVVSLTDGSRLPIFPGAELSTISRVDGRAPIALRDCLRIEQTGGDAAALELGCEPAVALRALPAFSADATLAEVLTALGTHIGAEVRLVGPARFLGGIAFTCELPAGQLAEQMAQLRGLTGFQPRFADDGALELHAAAIKDTGSAAVDQIELAAGWILRGRVSLALADASNGGAVDQATLQGLSRTDDGAVVAHLPGGEQQAVRFDEPLITITGAMGTLRVPVGACVGMRFAAQEVQP